MKTNLEFEQMPIGIDAEFFLKQGNEIKGSEKFIKGDDVINVNRSNGNYQYVKESKFTKDGVQIEINPDPNRCRIVLSKTVMECFHYMNKWLKEHNSTADFSGTVEVSKKEFDTLSDKSKMFGCSPDFNAHNGGKVNIKPSGETTRIRTAGGHIHFGFETPLYLSSKTYSPECKSCPLPCKKSKKYQINEVIRNKKINIHDIKESEISKEILDIIYKELKIEPIPDYEIKIPPQIEALKRPDITIPLIDLICGIPSVLIDRDLGAMERRKLYGKAGDYRLQPHGIEYRTLSNFWIRSYVMIGLFTGLARIGLLMAISDIKEKTNYHKDLFKIIDKKDMIKAINNNDYQLARDIFLKIEPILCKIGDNNEDNYQICTDNINAFKTFVLNGYKKYFGDDPITYWSKQKEGDIDILGWESFSRNIDVIYNVEEIFKNTVLD